MDQAQGPAPAVVELMERGMTIVRAENESQMSMAVQKPRIVQNLANAALAELRAFPEFAKKSYYSIPYKNAEGGTTLVEGPSIKAANALVRHWGNNASGFRVVSVDEERILIQGVFLDYETNMRRTAEISVNRKFKTRDGKTIILDVKRLEMAIQAGGSKAVRNAILNALPAGLVEGYFAEAKRIVSKGGKSDPAPATPEDIAEVREGIFKAFEGMQISRDEIVSYIGRHPEMETEEAVVAHLQGALNAIAEGGLTVEDMFSTGQQAPIAMPKATTSAPGSGKPAQAASKAALPAFPASLRPMVSKRESKCFQCGKDILVGQDIGYDPKAGKAAHRNHYA